MTRSELERLIKQIEEQIEVCQSKLASEKLGDEERENIEEQILRQMEELNVLKEQLQQMPDDILVREVEVVE